MPTSVIISFGVIGGMFMTLAYRDFATFIGLTVTLAVIAAICRVVVYLIGEFM